MSNLSKSIRGYLDYPRQKLPDSKKTDEWYKKNIDFAENLLNRNDNLRASFKNKQTNYNLRVNKINPKDFERYINPDKLDLSSLPASFQHIGIENTKINLLIGEYHSRKKEFRAYLSSNDKDGISRKEQQMLTQMQQALTELIKSDSISEEEIQKRLIALEKYQKYDLQDIAEITANKILKKEYKEGDFDFIFLKTFEDLLTSGEQIAYCGVLGGNPVLRRVDTMNLYTLGGDSMYIEDSDIIVEYGYKSIGQVIDDYWDELTEEEIEFLETGYSTSKSGGLGIGLNRDISLYDRFGEENSFSLLEPNAIGTRTFAGAFDGAGNIRVMKVCWRSRRKIGKLKYFDEDGQEQQDFVPEDYIIRKELGEEVKWIWVNEWMEGTKIGDDIYTVMRPIPYASKSLVNKSKGTPPYIGSVNATNSTSVQSMMDIMKPLAYSYDIAYYRRELEIATYKGSFAAINSALIPSGWKPEEWIRYLTINKLAFLDPTNEILKGPSQGKSAGAFNQLTAQNVQLGDPNAIQMFTNILIDIENTLGKLAGVTGGREGQIENREAVNNVEREINQTSHITEKWFAIDDNFRKRVLTKFMECCKYSYKMNPKKGQFLLDDMGQEMVKNFDEFCNSEMDIFMSNSRSDTQLHNELKKLQQAALSSGQATLADVISIAKSESTQDMARKLEDSAARIREEQNQQQQQQMKVEQERTQLEIQDKQAERQFISSENEKDRQVKREEIQAKLELGNIKEISNDVRHTIDNEKDDSDANGIGDYLDIRRTDIDENYKKEQIQIAKDKLKEQERSNKSKEIIAKSKMSSSKTAK